jgi:Ca2+-binding RTX toxin-like protein
MRGGRGPDEVYGTFNFGCYSYDDEPCRDGDILLGGRGADQLTGYTGRDRLYGALHDDELHGGENNDELFGGPDRDACYARKDTTGSSPAKGRRASPEES